MMIAKVPTMSTPDDQTHHALFDTPLGPCGVAWNGRGLAAVQLPEKDRATTERKLAAKCASDGRAEPPAWVQSLISDIQSYMAGQPVDFSGVTVDLSGLDDHRRRLYEALREIGFGRTTTYGELARTLGATDWEGARDVGDAMGHNRMPIVIPCHRVLAAGGKLGGFSAYGGVSTKKKLLALEGVHLDGGAQRLPGF
jgi:methylated-DNA-[protein]-cysteine S-methyltransferase